MRFPVLSILIPAYNAAPHLEATQHCLEKQAMLGMEIIVVDDGSTDETSSILAGHSSVHGIPGGSSLSPLHPLLRVITHPTNRGLSAARNTALEAARGEYVIFLDADDLLMPGALASQLRFLRGNHGIDLAVCRNILFESTDIHGAPLRSGEWKLFEADLDVHLCHFNIAPPHAFMFKREAAAGLRFDESLNACEDHDFWFKMLRRGIVPRPNPDACVAYRRHPGSMSANLRRQRQHDAKMHLRIAEALLADSNFPQGGQYEARLACRAGCLCTAARLRRMGGESGASALDRAASAMLSAMGGLRPGRAPDLSDYFERRIARLEGGEVL